MMSNGVDIVEVNRFRAYKSLSHNFFNELFTKGELEYCLKKKDPYQHIAARFAAKEAVYKAFGNLNILIPLRDIEIDNKNNKSVQVNISSKKGLSAYNITLTLSHTESLAIAFCTVYK